MNKMEKLVFDSFAGIMKRFRTLESFRSTGAFLRVGAVGALLLAVTGASGQPSANEPNRPFDAEFFIQALGDRCLDFGGEAYWAIGGPVYIYSCNGSAAQKVRIKELDDGSHDVELRVRDLYCIGASGADASVAVGDRLELQRCDGSARQRFALDGDAILMGAQQSGRVTREFVIEPERGFTANHTPLVVGTREVNDAEYFRFRAVDGSQRRPHSGFMTASNEPELDRALSLASWGTVIELLDHEPIRLSGTAAKSIPPGVTLRGYRKYTYQGPEVFRCTISSEPAFRITEEDVRLTGFRFRGPAEDPTRCPTDAPAEAHAIEVKAHTLSAPIRLPTRDGRFHTVYIEITTVPRVLFDHLDIGYWKGSAIDVKGPDAGPNPDPPNPDDDYKTDCPNPPIGYPRETRLRAIGNFIHHVNVYGVVTGQGAFSLADANVFYAVDHHAIASDGTKTSGYLAYHNLMLSPSGSHEIDVHGSLHRSHWYDGIAGNYYDVGWNTVLGLKKSYDGQPKVNVSVRGTPCHRVDLHHNVFRRSESKTIASLSLDPANKLKRWANIFNDWAPLNDLAVGDFDADGIDDVFVGTGAAWYFSSGGRAEWRFLNRMPEKASALRFGDFDGDGRTDVLALHNGQIDISWAGGSPWQTVNVTAWQLSDLAVGDFDGDRRSDLFLATDTAWFVAPGARNWAPYSTQAIRTPNLRFGDFTGDGKTDVVAAGGGTWRLFTKHAQVEQWLNLHPNLSGSIAGVVAADFTGDGKADLARSSSGSWWLSDNGLSSWTKLRSATVPGYGTITNLMGYPVGHFYDGNATADVVFWSGTTGLHFDYAPGARDPITRLSRQPMK
jgi:hypothetical protein